MDKQKILDITAKFSDESPTNFLSPAAEAEEPLLAEDDEPGHLAGGLVKLHVVGIANALAVKDV